MVSDLTQQLASKADASARRLQDGGLDGLVADLKRFARNRPGLFLAASMGAGFMATRLLRSTDTKSLVEAAKPESGSAEQTPALPAPGQQPFDRGGVAPDQPMNLVGGLPPVPTQ